MTSSFHIEADCRPLFKGSGLNSYEAFMQAPLGEMVSRPGDRRRLFSFALSDQDGQCHRFFLKRMTGEPLWLLLKSLAAGRRPHCGPIRELQLLQALSHANFAVMSPVAWGEQRRFGVPVGGFLVVAEVPGRDVADLCRALPASERQALLHRVGQLIGRLHAYGFFHPVRLKDLILDLATERMVMIDRETGKPWPTRFSSQRATVALARTGRRTLRDGHRFGPASIRSFLSGYVVGVGSLWPVSVCGLRRIVIKHLRKELR